MRIDTRRAYCPSCQKLVRVRAEVGKSETQILCTQCGRQLYSFNGVRWNVAGQKATPAKTAATNPVKK